MYNRMSGNYALFVCGGSKPVLLKEFIHDLQTGKLHREFHQGPDPVRPPPKQDVRTVSRTLTLYCLITFE